MSEHKHKLREFEGLTEGQRSLIESLMERCVQRSIDDVSETMHHAAEELLKGTNAEELKRQFEFEEISVKGHTLIIKKEVTAQQLYLDFCSYFENDETALFYDIDEMPNAKQIFEDIYNYICDYLLSIAHRESSDDCNIKLYFLNVQEVLVFKYLSNTWFPENCVDFSL